MVLREGIIGRDGRIRHPRVSFAVHESEVAPVPGDVVSEARVCHTHSAWYLAVECGKKMSFDWNRHCYVAICRYSTTEFRVLGVVMPSDFDGYNLRGLYIGERGIY